MSKPRKRLFLDDDPRRAEAFLLEHPDATWVETSSNCIARLSEPWDEVHLDHDLGGEHFVDSDRDDCGMAVVRWLEVSPVIRKNLRRARFTVHSHNMVAAYNMVLRIRALGYQVEARPFGLDPPEFEAEADLGSSWKRTWERALTLIHRVRDRPRRSDSQPEAGPEPIDAEPPGSGP